MKQMTGKVSGNTEEEVDASVENMFRKAVRRYVGKPLEECTKDDLNAAFPDGLDFDGGGDWEENRYVAEIGIKLGIPMADPTIYISEPFDADPGTPELRAEQTRLNFYLLCDGERIARRGEPDSPQAGLWVALVPGCLVRDTGEGVEVYFEGEREMGMRH